MTDKNFTNQSFNIFKKRNLNEERVIDKYKITQNMKLSEMYKNIYSSKVGVAINHIKTKSGGAAKFELVFPICLNPEQIVSDST